MIGLETIEPNGISVDEWAGDAVRIGDEADNDVCVDGLGVPTVMLTRLGQGARASQPLTIERTGRVLTTDQLLSGDVVVGPNVRVRLFWNDDATVVASRSIRDIDDRALPGDAANRLVAALRLLGQATDRAAALQNILRAVFAVAPGASHALLLLRDAKEANRFTLAASATRDGASHSLRASRSVLRHILATRSAVLTGGDDDLPSSESMIATNMTSVLAVPLWRGDDIVGIIHADNRHAEEAFSERDLAPMLLLAANASLALENAELIGKLRATGAKLSHENTYLRSQATPRDIQLIAEAPAMRNVLAQLTKVTSTRATVCITGETGTGKELIAATVHARSPRKDQLFVAQNCAAIPESLLESTLFGHVRGAFTGADADKKGLFELADGGTLFLDEIGEMPLSLQAKLLRVLQEGTIRPVGASTERQVNVRIVCATHRNLADEVKEGRFRGDLFYRLMVFPLALPSLRERKEDIAPLARHFLRHYAREMRVAEPKLDDVALAALMNYPWPGNVRELENEMQRVLIAAESDEVVTVDDLAPRFRIATTSPGSAPLLTMPAGASLKDRVEAYERQLLVDALREHGNNKTRTALALGITREGLHKKLAKFGV